MVRFYSYLQYSGTLLQIDDVEVAALPVPSTPTNLTATSAGNNDVILGWSGSAGSKYKIERSADGGSNWTQLADITSGATSYVDASVASTTAYQFRVRAYNTAGESSYSSTTSITTGDKSIRYVDVTISMYPTATLTTADDRAKYENIIKYFADGLYESSNSVNRLRKVTIYRDAKNWDTTHIQWSKDCWPCASTSGYIRPGTGARVYMCDIFSKDQNYLLNDYEQQAGGFGALTHEWGHYFYGLYDEYRNGNTITSTRITSPLAGDTPSTNSTMRTSDRAADTASKDGDLKWLNFSAKTSDFSINTAQGRVYGASSWEVLVRPKSQDPQNS